MSQVIFMEGPWGTVLASDTKVTGAERLLPVSFPKIFRVGDRLLGVTGYAALTQMILNGIVARAQEATKGIDPVQFVREAYAGYASQHRARIRADSARQPRASSLIVVQDVSRPLTTAIWYSDRGSQTLEEQGGARRVEVFGPDTQTAANIRERLELSLGNIPNLDTAVTVVSAAIRIVSRSDESVGAPIVWLTRSTDGAIAAGGDPDASTKLVTYGGDTASLVAWTEPEILNAKPEQLPEDQVTGTPNDSSH